MATVTPMMQQYLDTKSHYPDTILFFRLGDFYEMFFEDAKLVSRELELTLTGKSCGLEERAPMCGVPFHSADTYINQLIEKGYKVAICEQMEDPATAKGLVKREVVRIVTPGTVIDPGMLEDRRNSYLLCLCLEGRRAGIAYADVSTGEFNVYEIDHAERRLADEILRIAPREVLSNAPLPCEVPGVTLSVESGTSFQLAKARGLLLTHFKETSLAPFGVEDLKLGIRSAGALLQYLQDTQKNALEHITALTRYYDSRYMALDHTARRNLELTESLRTRQKNCSLLGILDYTCTSMGGRMLRSYIEQPLAVREEIEQRLDAVGALSRAEMATDEIRTQLREVYDVERLLSRIAYRTINPRDCLALLTSLQRIPQIRDAVGRAGEAALLGDLAQRLTPLEDITDLLSRAIDPEAPALISEGHYIRGGYTPELDELRRASVEGKQWISQLEAREREETGIKNLRIQYNRVFGYYIEVTKSNLGQVPVRYTRRQTLANCERYTTPELHEIEEKVLGAQEKAQRMEYALFMDIRAFLTENISRIQRVAVALKELDALCSLAVAALRNGYVRPAITQDGELHITGGRHPVVEKNLSGDDMFVANDTLMDEDANRMLIITGPNMAGKSTYMRQVALIVLMAHMGSFVPAEAASVSICDRIFTRIGASDDLSMGQSTFMVEMNEMAHILRNATRHSLVILDEIGRGTSTFDGLSIAWAVVEYMVNKDKIGCKTLFATHYHELSELEGNLEGVVNYRISVKEAGESIVFLRRIERGGTDKSFGIHVAHLAGLPRQVVMRANEILARVEASASHSGGNIGQNILDGGTSRKPKQVNLFEAPAMDLVEEIRKLDVMSMTPIEAMNTLFTLREKARLS